jgi:cytochrome c oxidase subunit 4
MSHTHDVKKEVRIYLSVFGALLFLTIVTVSVSYLHLNIVQAILLALFVATIKAGLVACYFMHLISEQKLIYSVLASTMLLFASMMFLIVYGAKDHLVGTKMVGHDAVISDRQDHQTSQAGEERGHH